MRKELKYLLLLNILLMAIGLQAQHRFHEQYDWEKETSLLPLEEKYQDEAFVIQKYQLVTELAYEGEALYEYRTIHKIIRLNNLRGVESNNKVYISMNKVIEMIDPKVRVIGKDGSVSGLNAENIREENLEGYGSFKFFAIDGAEVGSEIEIMYTLKQMPEIYGNMEYFQDDEPYKNVDFKVITPANLDFAFRSYNGFPEMKKDTTVLEYNVYRAAMAEIPAFKEESFGALKANLMVVNYKLEANLKTNAKNLIAYSDVARNVYQRLQNGIDKSTKKLIQKEIKTLGLGKSLEEEENIRRLENYIKSNYNLVGYQADRRGKAGQLSDLKEVLESKNVDKQGIVKLFTAFLDQLGIAYEIGLTSDRLDIPFDKDFETYVSLREYFIYFPQHETYLAPDVIGLRYWLIPSNWTGQHALFIQPVNVGGIETAVGYTKYLEPVEAEVTSSDLDISFTFGEDLDEVEVDVINSMSGYYGVPFQAQAAFFTEEIKEGIMTELILNLIADAEIKEKEMLNISEAAILKEPLIVKSKLATSAMIQNAGPKFLFKIGTSIGPQSELYQEKERQLPVANLNNHQYRRKLTFAIPEGYKVANLEALKMDIRPELSTGDMIGFTSDYIVEGKQVTVDIFEYYRQLDIPVEEYPLFAKVVNAAADFNKITLIFEKED